MSEEEVDSARVVVLGALGLGILVGVISGFVLAKVL